MNVWKPLEWALVGGARTADGTIFSRDATVDLTGTEQSPVSIRSWRQGERVLFPSSPTAGG